MSILTRTAKGSELTQAEADANLTELDRRAPKAFVNFNGTGTIAIRQAYSVASITDNGVGDYTINIAAGVMPDGDYAISGGGKWDSATNNTEIPVIGLRRSVAPTATAARILTIAGSTAGVFDPEIVSVALHR